ncbi:hypothetical protein B4113_3676 [Geobacillus sp. B4113_201601]|nr:hypothetical protein B4113_3676 [Geobacillus sp. B4113_201601]
MLQRRFYRTYEGLKLRRIVITMLCYIRFYRTYEGLKHKGIDHFRSRITEFLSYL